MTIRVLMSPGQEISNPFISLLLANLDEDVVVETFTWKRAFLERYDVLHIHWPDSLLEAPSPPRRAIKVAMLSALLLRNRLAGVKHVWTVHNLSPHETGGKMRSAALDLWVRSCKHLVYLSAAAIPERADPRSALIKHGDYSNVTSALSQEHPNSVPGRLLVFGLLRPYKGVEALIETVSRSATEGITLRAVGRPVPIDYGDQIQKLAENSDKVTLRLERLPDADLVAEIEQAEIVVLPYKRIYNSGAALLALTAGRPIIATDSATMRELQLEVGPEWVQLLDSELDELSLAAAVKRLRSQTRADRPSFEGRSWSAIGSEYSELYRA